MLPQIRALPYILEKLSIFEPVFANIFVNELLHIGYPHFSISRQNVFEKGLVLPFDTIYLESLESLR